MTSCEDRFYITTAIDYANGSPHMGHAYEKTIADVIARYHRLAGQKVYFLTGTDEHGQKVEQSAKKRGITPLAFCDENSALFRELCVKFEVSNDDFIRTTEPRHKRVVQKVLQSLFDKGEIYKAEYKGHYCSSCERFYTEKDILEGGLCPECKRPTSEIIESNYFFKMSKYQDWLIERIKSHPDFILPAFRANETLGFLRKPLEDLCISRPKARMAWGIELPFDKDYVCYVWFDALINYVSAIGYGFDEETFNKWWPHSHHMIGKDILTPHSVYWPIMLKAMGVEPPQSLFVHGWWLLGESKMSKSLGNVVDPMKMAEKYGVDAFRYFLVSEMTFGQDASFTEEALVARFNSDLANDLGNLLNRVVKLIIKFFDGKMPEPGKDLEDPLYLELDGAFEKAVKEMKSHVDRMSLDKGLANVMNLVREANRYIEHSAPWALAKKGDTTRLGTVLYTAAEALRVASGLLLPVMPKKMEELRRVLGLPENEVAETTFESLSSWGGLKPGSKIKDIDALFPRIKIEETEPTAVPAKAAAPAAAKKEQSKKADAPLPEGIITIDDFCKVQLKTAKVLEAERLKGADKLLKLKIEIGGETRPLVAGIAKFYTPEEMVGKTIIVVANLKPRKLMGVESQGMLLAAKDSEGKLKLATIEGGFASGCGVG